MAVAIHATTLSPRLQSRIWQGDQLAHAGARAVSSGHPDLDALLPGAGWPAGSLTELLVEHGGVGEMRLLAPALKALTAPSGPQPGRHVLLVAPPGQAQAEDFDADALLSTALATAKPSQAAAEVARATGLDRKALYARALELKAR